MSKRKTMDVDTKKYLQFAQETGLSGKELSAKLGQADAFISKIRTEKRPYRPMTITTAILSACIFGCELKDLEYHEQEQKQPEKQEQQNVLAKGITAQENEKAIELLEKLVQEQIETRKMMQMLIDGLAQVNDGIGKSHTMLARIRARLENTKGALREFGNPKAREIIKTMCGAKCWAAEENILKEAEKQNVPIGDMKDMLLAMNGEKQTRGFGDRAHTIWLIPKDGDN